MGIFASDSLDEACKTITGHDNWTYATFSQILRAIILPIAMFKPPEPEIGHYLMGLIQTQ